MNLTTKSICNSKRRILNDKILRITIIALSIITISPIILIVSKLILSGYKQLNISLITEIPPDTYSAMIATSTGDKIPGGIVNGIIGTLLIVSLATILAIPVGIVTGIYLYENQNKRWANLVRSTSDILQGIPSIVIGFVSYLWIVKHVTNGYSALAGSISLAIMMMPMIIRSTEETFKMIPVNIKEAAIALGVPYYKVILKVLIPSGFSGLFTGILLGTSRVLGETAPLMLTALGSSMINLDITKPTSAIPLLIWEFYNDPNMINLIWSSSLILMVIVLFMNILSKQLAKK